MRWRSVLCGVLLVGCGGSPIGSHDDDGTDPRGDAALDARGPDDPGGAIDAAVMDSSTATPLQPIAQDASIFMMRADATHVYWANHGTTTRIKRMPRTGGAIETLYTAPGYTMGLELDGGFVYVAWIHDAKLDYAGAIVRFPVAGGAATTLVSPTGVRNLAVSDGWIYYGDMTDYEPRVMKVPVTGGMPHFIVRPRANAAPYELRADAGYVFFVDDYAVTRVEIKTKKITTLFDGAIPTDLTLDSAFVYFVACSSAECFDATAYRVPRSGGAREPLGSGEASRSRIDAIDDSLLWGARVLSISGGLQRLLPVPQAVYAVVATHDAYFLGSRTGAIYRVPR